MKKFTFIFGLLLSFALSAQHGKHLASNELVYDATSIIHFTDIANAEKNNNIELAIYNELGLSSDFELILVKERTSLKKYHKHYKVEFEEIEIFNLNIIVGISRANGHIEIINQSEAIFNSFETNTQFPAFITDSTYKDQKHIWFPLNNGYIKALEYRISNNDHQSRKRVINTKGEFLLDMDLNKYLHEGPDSLVSGMAFVPDPLSTAMVSYGGAYRDFNDADSSVLSAERDTVYVFLQFNGTNFIGENKYVKIGNFSSPTTIQISTSQTFLDYERDEDQFEDFNVIYHITNFTEHLQSLGFQNVLSYQIEVDAHALSGQDNSAFEVPAKRLLFGEGGVDDAEDCDVIVHEFCHALLEDISNNSSSLEARCLEEALCDYFAGSYSGSFTAYGNDEVYSWDGHNEYWPGRELTSTDLYTQLSFNANIYAHTSLWNSSMREILLNLGRTITDKIFVEALYQFNVNTTMPQMARLIIEADNALYQGAHFQTIKDAFVRRAILSSTFSLNEIFGEVEYPIVYGQSSFSKGGNLFIQFEDIEETEISMYDVTGRFIELNNHIENSQLMSLNALNLKKGFYLLRLEKEGREYRFKLLIH